MSPPPPPLGRGRRRKSAHVFDAALDDVELQEARSSLAQGRWSDVRELLQRTGESWDRRGHRLCVLAQEQSTVAWARDWQVVEPESADAVALEAFAHVFRALGGKGKPDLARRACQIAARRRPEDPTPWLALLLLERHLGRDEDVVRLFDAVRHRHPEHHHAHHLMVARLAERHPGAGQDPLHEVYDFASWAAEQAAADSPLALLPVVAHAERYRVLAGVGSEAADPVAAGHWSGRRARQVMNRAFDWWLQYGREEHVRNRVDLNFLAHAKFCQGRSVEAAALFHRIGPHITPHPWSYPDRDPFEAFRDARDHALGAA